MAAVTEIPPERASVLARALDTQRGHLFLWVPVCLAAGIAAWFALRVEPARPHYLGALGLAFGCSTFGWIARGAARPLLWALALALAGGLLAGLRAHLVDGPVLAFRHYGPVEGRIVAVDRSASDRARVTLDRVSLPGVRGPPPRRVRISLHWDGAQAEPRPGRRVAMTANLGPPAGPAEPGGFDFRRHAYFARIGAIGYARGPMVLLAEPAPRERMVGRIRASVAAALRARIGGEPGEIAAALVTGDRSGVSQDVADALRRSNLAHLLAISGLHMGLVTGTVFGALRLVGAMAWRRAPARAIAAAGGMAAGAAYLALSGASVATERAFVMALVVLGAVLMGRRALTMRGVALAALVVLAWRPEALAGPGFRMSFAATAALVAVFGALRGVTMPGGAAGRWVGALALSSLVAGLATAPIAAATFNQVPHYGLPANLLAVPIMSVVVMPSAVLAALLAPLGLAAVPLWAMGQGIEAILAVAAHVAALPGAVSHVASPPPAVIPLYGLALALLCAAQGPLRAAGAVPLLFGLVLWHQGERPTVLVDGQAGIVGIVGPEGRAMSRERGGGFVATIWLENDGDPVPRPAASARPPGPWGEVIAHLPGRKGLAAAVDACVPGRIVVLNQEPDRPLGSGCEVISPRTLRGTGAIAFHGTPDRHTRVDAVTLTGCRRWTPCGARVQ